MAQFLASNVALGLALLLVVAALGWAQRQGLIDLVHVDQRSWRVIAWSAIGLTLALILWCTFADDWRKIFGELLDLREQYASQRAVRQPVAQEIRTVTLLLLLPAMVLAGALFARNVGGYGLQFALIILGISAFLPLYLIRQRLDTGLAGVIELPAFFSLAMLSTIFYLLLDYAVNIGLILTSYLGLLGMVAIPVTIVLDLLGQREPPVTATTEMADFYTNIRHNLEAQRKSAAEQIARSEQLPPPDSPRQ